MGGISERLQQTFGVSDFILWNVSSTIAVILILWLGRSLILRTALRRTEDVHERYRWRKISGYIAFFIGFVAVVRLWFPGLQSLATMIGIISAGVAVALKDPLVSLAGWVFIMWRRPFSVGDRIQVGNDVRGDVIDQRIFQFSLMEIGNWVHADQSTGRVIHIPNGRVFTDVIANYSRGFKYIWDEVAVLLTFESDWEKAKGILDEIAGHNAQDLSRAAAERIKEASKKWMIFYTKLTPIVYTSVEDSGVLLTMRYLTEPQERRGRMQAIWEDVLRAFAQHEDIDFAYPTQRFYANEREGKRAVAKGAASMDPPPGPNNSFGD